ncbi:MAG: MaoC family dehydratase [Burkholderiaceae bacterium]
MPRSAEPAADPRRWFDDLRVGENFETHAVTIDAQQIIDFARHYDAQWFHLDAERAQRSIFKGLSAPGFQTASLLWGLTVAAGYFRDSSIAGLGLDTLRWSRPLLAGDSLKVRITVLALRPSASRPGCGVATLRYEGINQRGEVLIMLEMKQLLLRHAAAPHEAAANESGT